MQILHKLQATAKLATTSSNKYPRIQHICFEYLHPSKLRTICGAQLNRVYAFRVDMLATKPLLCQLFSKSKFTRTKYRIIVCVWWMLNSQSFVWNILYCKKILIYPSHTNKICVFGVAHRKCHYSIPSSPIQLPYNEKDIIYESNRLLN